MTIISTVILSVSIQLHGTDKNSSNHSQERIKKLITQLGDAKFATREDATIKLISLGYYARTEVQRSLNSKDPEVRMRLKRIWKEINWNSFPGAQKDVKELLAKMQPIGSDYPEWEMIAKKYGAKLLLMILELNEKDDYRKQALNVLKARLKTKNSNSIATYIQTSPKKDQITAMITSFRFDKIDKSESEKLLNIFYILNMKQDVLQIASSIWRESKATNIPPEIMDYFKDNEFTNQAFETLHHRLDKSETSSLNDWQIGFFAKIAKEIKRTDLIKDLLNEMDYNITDKTAIIYLSEILISIKLYNEALNILSELHTPKGIYLRAVAYNNAGEKQKAAQLIKLLDSKLTSEKNCFAVADEMDKFKDVRAVTILHKILKMKPDNSVYDANARFRLAEFYSSKGKYAKAADMMEQGMKQMKGLFTMTINGQIYSGKEAKERSLAKIADLRAQEKGGAELWYNAIRAIRRNEDKKALKLFEDFIKNNPEYHRTYYLRSIILLRKKENENAIKELSKAISHTPQTNLSMKTQYILEKAIIERKNECYDAAIKTLKEAVKLNPTNENYLMMLAMTTFYTGYYKKAAELYSKCSELNPKDLYAPLWEFIAMKKLNLSPEKEFAKFADTINGDKWPIPIIRYYANTSTREECIKAANSANKKRENEKKCEAYYFIGAYLQGLGEDEKATKMFKKCIKGNITNFREHKAAIIELAK